jgi:hypothetical protein
VYINREYVSNTLNGDILERIFGPFKGYYVASFACQMGELGNQYLGLSKVFSERPQSYWDAGAVLKVSADLLVDSPESAMAQAERSARMQIAHMAPAGVPLE